MTIKEESRQKIGWEEEALLLELLFREPNEITEADLLSISLSNLAKNVNDKLPASMTMKIYLRWLEARRKNPDPSPVYNAWPNTIRQWGQSLKHRGFTKEEVISEVEDWEKANGPFNCQSTGWADPKYSPSTDIIERAFDENHSMKKDRSVGKVDSNRGGHRSERSSGSGAGSSDYVPPNYVCNRCGKNGHLVKHCPTNMDPAFDIKPPKTYQCTLCNKFGKHWYSLCPKNTREDSITQRRLAAGREVPVQQRSLTKRADHRPKLENTSMPNDITYKGREQDSKDCYPSRRERGTPLDNDDSEEPRLPARTNKLELLTDTKDRTHKVSASMAYNTRISTESVAEMAGVSITNTAATIMAANRKRARSMGMDDVDYAEHQRTIRQKVNYDDNEELMDDAGRFMHSDDERQDAGVGRLFKESDPYTEEFGLRQNLPSRKLADVTEYSLTLPQSDLAMRPRRMSPSTMDTSSEEDIRTPVNDMEEGFDSPRLCSETPEKIYSDFVKGLIQNRTEGQVVNQRRRRPTALEIWDEDDQRRIRQLNFSTSFPQTPQRPPTVSPISSSGSSSISSEYVKGSSDDAMQVDHPFDQAPCEIPHLGLGNSIPVSPSSDISMQEAMTLSLTDVNDGKAWEPMDTIGDEFL